VVVQVEALLHLVGNLVAGLADFGHAASLAAVGGDGIEPPTSCL
jgi:hypothetical protein